MNNKIVNDSEKSVNRFGLEPMVLESIVINQKVTEKIHFAFNLTDKQIENAGSSTLKVKDGVLVNEKGIFISGSYSGKMLNMPGCSGYAGNNSLCLKRALDGNSVCAHCFSLVGIRHNNIPAYTKNDLIFSTIKFNIGDLVLDPEFFPYFRFSTHGDTMNALHVYNALVTAKTNPETQFTIWTKNVKYWIDGLAMYEKEYGKKPDNFFAIYSWLITDGMPSIEQRKTLKRLGFDAVFVVYNTWASQDLAVNSGAKRCVCGTGSCRHHCKFCYDRIVRNLMGFDGNSDAVIWIAEIMDGANHKE